MQIGRHTLFNLAGLGLPLLVAVFTIPELVRALGAAQFGLLTLVWAAVSYFGLFDLGLGRALTLQLAGPLAKGDLAPVGPAIATASVLMGVLGLLAGLLMGLGAPWAVGMIHDVPDADQAVRAVQALAVAMPAIVLTSGFRGILEARHAFGIVNLIRLPMGVFTFVGPLVVVHGLAPRLDWIAWVLCAGRWVALLAHAVFALKAIPPAGRHWTVHRALVRPMCVSGGWLTVSNIISPFMGYVDRFVIGATVSAAAVAYYATPNELITKLWIVPGALTAVLFPAFAGQLGGRSDAVLPTFRRAVLALYGIMLPLTLAFALFAEEILSLWIGPDFARQSGGVLRIFAVGMLVNSLAHVPFTLIQSSGRARLTASIHALELPVFLVILWVLTLSHGLLGAAVAWLLRIVADTALMLAACLKTQRWAPSDLFDAQAVPPTLLTAVGFAGLLVDSPWWRAAWLLVVVVLSAAWLLSQRHGPAHPA